MPSVIDVEKQPTPPPGGLLQPTILVPRQQRLPQPPQVLLPPLLVEQLRPAVPWPLEQGLDLAQSQLRKLQMSSTHPECRRKMPRTT